MVMLTTPSPHGSVTPPNTDTHPDTHPHPDTPPHKPKTDRQTHTHAPKTHTQTHIHPDSYNHPPTRMHAWNAATPHIDTHTPDVWLPPEFRVVTHIHMECCPTTYTASAAASKVPIVASSCQSTVIIMSWQKEMCLKDWSYTPQLVVLHIYATCCIVQ